MATTRFKGETAGERLDLSSISDSDMIQLRHMPGTIEDADKGISKSQLQSCPFGVSSTAAGTAAKTASLTDSNPDFILVSGREVVVCFTTANTASNPTLNFAGSGAIPIYMPNGSPAGAWNAGAWMHLKYFYVTIGNSTIQRWILLSQEVDNEVIQASSTSITGKTILSGSSIKIMFTAAISGSNTTTALSLSYNGTAYTVKVGKNGALANFVASEVSSGVYEYVQAYTTLDLAFNGTDFIIIGNPVVYSDTDTTIYADGLKRQNSIDTSKNLVTSNAIYNALGNINHKTIDLGYDGERVYLLLNDVTTWYNSTSVRQKSTFDGIFITQRLGDGNTASSVYAYTISVGYFRNNTEVQATAASEISKNKLAGNETGINYKVGILEYNNKYYTAIKRDFNYTEKVSLIYATNDNPLFSVVRTSDITEIYFV